MQSLIDELNERAKECSIDVDFNKYSIIHKDSFDRDDVFIDITKIKEKLSQVILFFDSMSYGWHYLYEETNNKSPWAAIRLTHLHEYRNHFMQAPKKPRAEIKTYLMIDKRNGFIKIGKSVNPFKREKTLQSEVPTIRILHVFNKDIENSLHKEYKHLRVRGEWFKLSEEDIKEIIKGNSD